MVQKSYKILVNLHNLYQDLTYIITNEPDNFYLIDRKRNNLLKYLDSKGIGVNNNSNLNIFLSKLEIEVSQLNQEEKTKLKLIISQTLWPLQTGDLILFNEIATTRDGLLLPVAIINITNIVSGVGKKKGKRKNTKKKNSKKKKTKKN
mgnify:CR=1 FL=1